MPERFTGRIQDRQPRIHEPGLTPERLTEVFFNQNDMDLARNMQSRIIVGIDDADPNNSKMIKVVSAIGYTQAENDKTNYLKDKKNTKISLRQMAPGAMGIFPIAFRHMRQPLISALSNGERGGCVQIEYASKFNPATGQFVEMPKQGDIAEYLELDANWTVNLRFIDNSGILYYNRNGIQRPPETQTVRP